MVGWRGAPRSLPMGDHCPLPIKVLIARLEGTRCAEKWHRRGDTTVSLSAGPSCQHGLGRRKAQLNPATTWSTDPSLPWKIKHSSNEIFSQGIGNVLPWLPRP